MNNKNVLIEELINAYEGKMKECMERNNETEFYAFSDSIWDLRLNPANYTEEYLKEKIAKYN